jgi:hypothetical protein
MRAWASAMIRSNRIRASFPAESTLTSDQNVSVAKAKKAISDYKKAVGLSQGVAELSVFYCEEVASLLSYCGMEDEGYFAALVRVFHQALTIVVRLPQAEQGSMLARLDKVRTALRDVGRGVREDIDAYWHDLVAAAGS